MRKDGPPIVAIFCSDIHLSQRAPVARSSEPDWYAAQGRGIQELQDLSKKLDAPVIVAGDIFDKWDSSAELINWAFPRLKGFVTIPGQHDLPLHNLTEMHRSAYYTLSITNCILDMCCLDQSDKGWWLRLEGGSIAEKGMKAITLHAFPWGKKVIPMDKKFVEDKCLNVAVIHEYCWAKGLSHPRASRKQHVLTHKKKLRGYDAAVFGDNHKGFLRGNILNCGTFFRRYSDEMEYYPQVGLLRADGSITRYTLRSNSKDIFTDVQRVVSTLEEPGLEHLSNELRNAASDGNFNFSDYVRLLAESEDVTPSIREILLDALEI